MKKTILTILTLICIGLLIVFFLNRPTSYAFTQGSLTIGNSKVFYCMRERLYGARAYPAIFFSLTRLDQGSGNNGFSIGDSVGSQHFRVKANRLILGEKFISLDQGNIIIFTRPLGSSSPKLIETGIRLSTDDFRKALQAGKLPFDLSKHLKNRDKDS